MVKKFITGFVAQSFEDGKCVGQDFSASDQVEYEDAYGNALMQDEAEEQIEYFPMKMIQPDDIVISNENFSNIQEQIQEDLLCLLDEVPVEIQERACQIVIDNFKKISE